MLQAIFHRTITILFTLAAAACLYGHGQSWDFLGRVQLEREQNHGTIRILRRGQLFHTIQFRVSGAPVFFDHVVLRFHGGDSQELIVNSRVSSERENYVIDLASERGTLESVDLWYYKEPWEHNPRVSLYGIHLAHTESESVAFEH